MYRPAVTTSGHESPARFEVHAIHTSPGPATTACQLGDQRILVVPCRAWRRRPWAPTSPRRRLGTRRTTCACSLGECGRSGTRCKTCDRSLSAAHAACARHSRIAAWRHCAHDCTAHASSADSEMQTALRLPVLEVRGIIFVFACLAAGPGWARIFCEFLSIAGGPHVAI